MVYVRIFHSGFVYKENFLASTLANILPLLSVYSNRDQLWLVAYKQGLISNFRRSDKGYRFFFSRLKWDMENQTFWSAIHV